MRAAVSGVSIKLDIGAGNAYVNGKVLSLDSPAVIIKDRTMVPLRFVAEAVGAEVAWDPAARQVTITR